MTSLNKYFFRHKKLLYKKKTTPIRHAAVQEAGVSPETPRTSQHYMVPKGLARAPLNFSRHDAERRQSLRQPRCAYICVYIYIYIYTHIRTYM